MGEGKIIIGREVRASHGQEPGSNMARKTYISVVLQRETISDNLVKGEEEMEKEVRKGMGSGDKERE